MAYCRYCGNEIDDHIEICPKCGVPTNNRGTKSVSSDNGGFGWGLLGFCIPIVGLILFLIWKEDKPKTSKAAGIGALIGFILTIIIYVVYFIFIFGDLSGYNYF